MGLSPHRYQPTESGGVAKSCASQPKTTPVAPPCSTKIGMVPPTVSVRAQSRCHSAYTAIQVMGFAPDRAHFREYVRLLDAHASGMSRDEMCISILSIDPAKSPDSAYEILNSHLERAKWMSSIGYRQV